MRRILVSSDIHLVTCIDAHENTNIKKSPIMERVLTAKVESMIGGLRNFDSRNGTSPSTSANSENLSASHGTTKFQEEEVLLPKEQTSSVINNRLKALFQIQPRNLHLVMIQYKRQFQIYRTMFVPQAQKYEIIKEHRTLIMNLTLTWKTKLTFP
ncbi:hypothetical protein GIB67_022404 [Kingdonia uniflora]|uniref:Uncharacterized protein n=1 Tax=Kingdonia uniflora TaxID=39325 RepID=A0A7J7MU10_9MAGN|nr:hypothetical protein GIB67_022404 [Kingdonia uniflora]